MYWYKGYHIEDLTEEYGYAIAYKNKTYKVWYFKSVEDAKTQIDNRA